MLAGALVIGAFGVARAQQPQSFVSGVGDDANPCSRTAPCATFAAALAATMPGGEIDALDTGDFGAVTITSSVTINGLSVGGSDFSGVNTPGVTVAAGATDVVILRGLSIFGSGSGNGLSVMSGGFVQLDHARVSGFGEGVSFTPMLGGQLLLTEVVTKDNNDAGLVAGASGGTASVTMSGCQSEGNAVGVRATAGAKIDVYDTDASHNATAGVSAELDANGGAAEINLESVNASENGIGVRASAMAGSAVVRMSKVLGTANVMAPVTWAGNGSVLSFGNNRLDVVPLLALSSTAPSQSVTAGADATYPLALAVTGLLSAPVTFDCTNLPAGASCSFSPSTLPIGTTTGTITLTISTTSSTGTGGIVWPRAPKLPPLFVLLFAVASLAIAKRPKLRRPLGTAAALAAVIVCVTTIAACGSSTTTTADLSTTGGDDLSTNDLGPTNDLGANDLGAPADLTPPLTPTPPGTYAITVTAHSGTLTGTLPLTLVVN